MTDTLRDTEFFRIAYITAGAGGMYCGSCMHDNTLARALSRKPSVECLLIPTYTPIRTDEENVSLNHVFLGGITVYLEERLPVFRYVPRFVTRLFDQPWLIRWVASRAIGTDPQSLGPLTISLLQGVEGHQRRDIRELAHWLELHARPHVINLSNMLIGGCIPELKRRLRVPITVTLQGDDIFIESLPSPYRERAVGEMRRLVPYVDAFLVNSRFYADVMGTMLHIPAERMHIVPLGVDLGPFRSFERPRAAERPLTVGYLARLAPEKGLHTCVEAYLRLKQMPGMETTRLHVAGWLGPQHRSYAEQQFDRIRSAGYGDTFHYAGSVSLEDKIAFLHELDLLSVPTSYREPKGLYVLEAMAAGVPVVQPAHGAFPELIETTGGGVLAAPEDPESFAQAWYQLLTQPEQRRELGERGRRAVRERLHADAVADQVLQLLQGLAAKARATTT